MSPQALGTQGSPHRYNHCTALHCTALYCISLHCTKLHCTLLSFTSQGLCHCFHPAISVKLWMLCNTLNISPLHWTALVPKYDMIFQFMSPQTVSDPMSHVTKLSVNVTQSGDVSQCHHKQSLISCHVSLSSRSMSHSPDSYL